MKEFLSVTPFSSSVPLVTAVLGIVPIDVEIGGAALLALSR